MFFNQATMHRSSELGGDTVAEAKRKGKTVTRDYGKDVQTAFESTTAYFQMSQ